jgi:RNA polymerase sigma-70 factor (ECF subfamily)
LNENNGDAVVNNPFKQLEWKDIYYYLDQLPPNTRYVCSLYYLEGFSIKEITNLIDMKEGTVKWQLNECRTRLKEIFERHTTRNSNIG